MATILVTGGTGDLGREVVSRLLARHHTPRVLSRQSHPDLPEGTEIVTGDLTSGSGLSAAVAGVDTIIHCASFPQGAQATDIGGTRLLVQAAHAAGSPHIIYVSIVGVDRATSGYYQAKYAAETIIAQSQLPWSIVRATQFHLFALRLIQSLGADTLNVIPVPPNVRLQPVDIDDVAERLVALAEEGPAGYLPDMAGPQVLTLEEIIQTYLHRRGRKATLRTTELPDSLFATFSADSHMNPTSAAGTKTWDEFLHYWYNENDSYPAAKKTTTILMEQLIQAHHPAQVTVHTVALDPGAQGAPPHRHPGPVFGYVVEGDVLFEMRGHAPRLYKQGEVFYEPDGCLHLLANNPSPTRRALFVAVLIGEPGQPILTPVQLQADTNDPLEPWDHSCS
ncbi:MAG TPA: NAD(P)H-binding protein [Ktedonobacteraceae bacterium]|nr:NAD(P)H-binding protein [Ktedonobacteraceae bacterium]